MCAQRMSSESPSATYSVRLCNAFNSLAFSGTHKRISLINLTTVLFMIFFVTFFWLKCCKYFSVRNLIPCSRHLQAHVSCLSHTAFISSRIRSPHGSENASAFVIFDRKIERSEPFIAMAGLNTVRTALATGTVPEAHKLHEHF